MRICIDVDGVICHTKPAEYSYGYELPIDGAVEMLRKWKGEGHYIIIYTARHMKTCGGNVGQVIAKQGNTLIKWLYNYNIPYDEIHFGKPYADVYIDDKAIKFTTWKELDNDINAD